MHMLIENGCLLAGGRLGVATSVLGGVKLAHGWDVQVVPVLVDGDASDTLQGVWESLA